MGIVQSDMAAGHLATEVVSIASSSKQYRHDLANEVVQLEQKLTVLRTKKLRTKAKQTHLEL